MKNSSDDLIDYKNEIIETKAYLDFLWDEHQEKEYELILDPVEKIDKYMRHQDNTNTGKSNETYNVSESTSIALLSQLYQQCRSMIIPIAEGMTLNSFG